MTSIKGLCPTCRQYRNAQVVAEYEEVLGPTFSNPIAEGHAYRTLKCGYCETIYFQHESLELTDEYAFHISDEDADNEGPPIADNLTELKGLAERWTNDNPGQFNVCEETVQ